MRRDGLEHRRAAALQRARPGVVVWWGEATQRYWALPPGGCLLDAAEIDDLVTALDADAARTLAGSRPATIGIASTPGGWAPPPASP